MFGFLGNIVGIIGKVIGVAASIIRIARPIIEAMRPAVEEIDQAMDWLEENATAVGEGGDDFLDRNIQTIEDLEAVSARGVVVFGKINELSIAMRVASQEKTPDTITEEEAGEFIRLIGEIKDSLGEWKGELDVSLASMKVTESEMEKTVDKG